MKGFGLVWAIVWLVAALAAAWPGDALAHGTGHRLLKDAPVVAIEFHYSDQAPMRYAEVLVFSPTDREVEHQNGRTDRHGRFVFNPDAEGSWVVKVTDGMGHAEEAIVPVGPELNAGEALKSREVPDSIGGGAMPTGLRMITGISLILNLAFAAHLLKRRSRASAGPAEMGSPRKEME
mgnify:CR=1 FL=1